MRRQRLATDARKSLAWGLVVFVAAQVGLNIFIEGWRPDIYDPEYYARLIALKAQRAENPDRPLLLLIGSSRTTMSFRPEILPPMRTASGRQPLVFNYSHIGAGPAASLMQFRRLLDEGIHPEWLVIEVMPPFLAIERLGSTTEMATARELPLLRRYFPTPSTYANYVKCRLLPWHTHRLTLLHDVAPTLLPSGAGPDGEFPLDPLGSWWIRQDARKEVPADAVRCFTAITRDSYFERLQTFHIMAGPARALRDLLELCRREHIQAALVMSPESTEYRAWYPPQAMAEVQAFCADLMRTYNVALVDARGWLADSDFFDGHHVVLSGANAFSQRLGTEVLEPLVQGKLPGAGGLAQRTTDLSSSR